MADQNPPSVPTAMSNEDKNRKASMHANEQRLAACKNNWNVQIRLGDPNGDAGVPMTLTPEENEKVLDVLHNILMDRKV